jgi:hypothetical protein
MSTTILQLKRPIDINGKTIESLNVDFDGLKGSDLKRIYVEHNARIDSKASDYNAEDLPMLFLAKLNGVIADDLISKLCASDYLRARNRVGSFFEELD